MRILFVTDEPSALSGELTALGHEVTVVPPRARACAVAIARHRPELAYVRGSALRATAVLFGLRVPYVLELDRVSEAQPKSTAMVRGARTIVATSEEIGRFAVGALGARDASIIQRGIDLELIAPGDRDEAKQRLSLQPGLRIVTMVDALERTLPLELLAEAHRKLTGTGLLVIGDGEGASFIQAMRAATRPSSPVLFLGALAKEESILAIRAAHACVSLRAGSVEYAACGRRQVTFAGPGPELLDDLYAEDLLAVQRVSRDAVALRGALEAAIAREERDPIPREEVEHARSLLGWAHAAKQLEQVLEDVLSE
jgi:glycosyltransferase involved in cell wall biosynthesis